MKFLAQLLATLVVLAGGVHFLHGFQVKRNAGVFLLAANEAEADKDFNKCLDYLSRYLRFRPKDTQTQARYALLLEEQATTTQARFRAFFVLEEALRTDPAREDVRRRVVALAITLSRFRDARDHLKILQQAHPHETDLVELLAHCQEAGAQFKTATEPGAIELYEEIIERDPQRVDCYVRLARIYRRLDQPDVADEVMKRLEKLPESVQARVALGGYLLNNGRLDEANVHIGYARTKLAPDDANALLYSAQLANARGQPDEERAFLQRGLKVHPDDLRFYLWLTRLELRAGRRAEARDCLQKALKLPDGPNSIWKTADLCFDAGAPEQAQKLLGRLSEEEPGVKYLRARLLLAEDKVAAACTLLEKLRPELGRRPNLARLADSCLGMCYERLGNPEQQLAAYKRAATGTSPLVKIREGLASALLANGQLDQAIHEYRALMTALPEMRLLVAKLLFLRNLRQPANGQNWNEVEELLKGAPAQVQNTAYYQLLSVDLLVAPTRSTRPARI